MPRLATDHLRAHGRPRIYGHRGASARAPENTLTAFALALDEGADGVELDVRRCASGEVVVFHDAELQRMVGVPDRVAELPYPQLRAYDLGAGEHAPLLDEVLDLMQAREAWVNVEVKAGGGTPHDVLVEAVARVLKRRAAPERQRIFLSTFHPKLAAALQTALPEVPLALLFDIPHTGLDQAEALLKRLDPEGAHPQYVLAQADNVQRWQGAGRFVNAWTVNEPDEVTQAVEAGVDGLITDRVAEVRKLLG